MFDPENPSSILSWNTTDVDHLPSSEDQLHEYKSSATTDSELGNKIARAASGFWNSGGGLLVAGVDGRGRPDGGLTLLVGNQPRRDWIDQQVGRVTPVGTYAIHHVLYQSDNAVLSNGHAVFLIGFGVSEVGPHMSPENRYYIRAGAHTIAASHFIVESIRARRGITRPVVRCILRRKPGNQAVIQLGLVTLTDASALDVELQIEPVPRFLQSGRRDAFPLHIPVINVQVPFFIDFHALTLGAHEFPDTTVRLKYHDMLGRSYEETNDVDVERQVGPGSLGATDAQRIEDRLHEIDRSIKTVGAAIGKNEAHLRSIVSKLR